MMNRLTRETRTIPSMLTAWLVLTAGGGDLRAETVEELLEPIRAEFDLPCLGGAIFNLDGIVESGAVGIRADGSPEKVTKDDLFHLGSCTKSMTATLIGILVDDGKMRWDMTVGGVFPELAGNMQGDWPGVTLEQLLTHTGGAPHNIPRGIWNRLWKREGSPLEQRMQLLRAITALPPEAKPGTKHIYSNTGYAIAGAMAERLTGTPWEELITARLFKPLGITTAGFGAPGTPDAVDQPRGHKDIDGARRAFEPGPGRADNPPSIGPGGIVHMTMADWSKYLTEHLRGAAGRSDLVRPETWNKLHTVTPIHDYAMGWGRHKRGWAGGMTLTHNGTNTMWYAVTWLAPERGFGVLAVTNLGGDEAAKATDRVSGALIRRYQK